MSAASPGTASSPQIRSLIPAHIDRLPWSRFITIFFGVAAEEKSLEEVATPLSVIGKPSEAIFRPGGGAADSPAAGS
jgi:hypothetical protein